MGISSAACGRSFWTFFFLTDDLSLNTKSWKGEGGHTRFQGEGTEGRKRVGICAYGNSLRLSLLEHFRNVLLASADFSFFSPPVLVVVPVFFLFLLLVVLVTGIYCCIPREGSRSSHLHPQQDLMGSCFLFCLRRRGGGWYHLFSASGFGGRTDGRRLAGGSPWLV